MEEEKVTLSIALAVFNESKNIDASLASVENIADEIVVVDGGSGDNTVELALKHHAQVIKTDNPPIFHINKQKALENCHSEWILQLDADEVVTEDLKNEIIRTINSKRETMNGYFISRRNYFWGHFMKKGGQYPDRVIRLVRRGKAHFPCKSVHEQMEVSGEVGYLKNPMLHYSYRSRADYWHKADTYTSLTAGDLAGSQKNGILLFIEYCLYQPIKTFLSLYIRHKGFMDAFTGLEFALYSGLHYPMAYIKYIKDKAK